ncbi:MAG: outer membrane beta-barrel protein [Cyclobacteriaceae bacterium]
MRFLFVLAIVFLISFESEAQFWFGPKIGGQMTSHSYQSKGYKNRYEVDVDMNWHAGFALQYTTEQRFAVHTELVYRKVKNRVRNKLDTAILDHSSTYNFLASAMHGRMTFGNGVVRFFALAGPRLSYWLGGSGSYISQEGDDNFGVPGGSYTIKFGESSPNDGSEILAVPRPNRIQYGLDIGFGAILDLASGQRLSVEARYSVGHSNMGFNDDLQLLEGITYEPDIQYTHDMIVFSVSYLFGYNPNDRRKGSSTNKLSNKIK